MPKVFNKKFKKYTSLSLASAVLLSAVPVAFAETPVVANTQEVADQALQSYLADSKGLFTAKATAETVNLPFSSELYYGHELLQDDNAKKAWDVIIRELLAYDPNGERTGVTYGMLSSGVGTITIDLQELGVTVESKYVSNLRNNLVNSDPRLFHLNGGEDVKAGNDGTAQTVTYYVQAGYAKDSKYQKTLLDMEERASQILSVVDERMTDAQKANAIYTKFTSSMKYEKNNGHWIMTGPLLEGGGICGGLSYAYQYLLQRAGIEAIWARDAEHAWNYMKIDGEWYFADSTWGLGGSGNTWLLRGKVMLNASNQPWNTYGKIPTLADTDYDRQALYFNPNAVVVEDEKVEDVVEVEITETPEDKAYADEVFATVVSVVKDVLTDHADELAQINTIYMFEPKTFDYAGNEVEKKIAEEIRERIAGKFTGSLSVILTNFDNFSTVEEYITKGLSVGFQAADNKPYYTYTSDENVEDENVEDVVEVETNESVADKTYATVVSVVEDVLTDHADELAQINTIYMFEPMTFEYVGNEVEEAIVEEIREGIAGKFTGSLSVVLTNFDNFSTVEEYMTEGLSVGFQASDDTPYYSYTSEGVEVSE